MSGATLTLGPATPSSLELERRRQDAERFIERSGDGAAIRALGDLRRDPTDWDQRLRAAASSQHTLKIALGVFLGIVAAEAAIALLRSDAIQGVLDQIEAALKGSDADGASGALGMPLETGAVALATPGASSLPIDPQPAAPDWTRSDGQESPANPPANESAGLDDDNDDPDDDLDIGSLLDDLLG